MRYQKMWFFLFGCFVLLYGQENIFPDPSFEQQDSEWILQTIGETEATLEYTAEAARTGDYGAEIAVTEIDSENWHVQLNTPTQWDAVQGQDYQLSFFAKCAGSHPIHVAVQTGSEQEYQIGYDFTLDEEWQKIEVFYTSEVEGLGNLRFNIYVGGATGTYYFDDFSLIEISEENPGAITLPEQGAYETGIYRNLFEELGKSTEDIDAKVDAAFQSLFHGNEENEAIYFEVENDMAFIKAIDSDDIRSEGLSYGMMIAVQLDKKEEFDKIWNFSKTHSQHQEGPREGYFAWQIDPYPPYNKIDENTAPDGDEYFAMALFFASHRWGDGEGIYNYSAEANQILHDMLHLEERNGGVVDDLTNMFNLEEKKIVFVPQGTSADYTDPSYHLPAFYKLWARWADEDNEFWAAAADTSREFLIRAMHDNTGLTTDYMTFAGEPQTTDFNEMSHRFAYDSWRVGMNIGFDCHWFGDEQWQPQQINTLLNFFDGHEDQPYKSLYEQDGTALADDNYHSTGLVAANGAAALGATDSIAWNFVSELWQTPVPTGQYRYYDGMLYMMSMLHAAGKFRIWHPEDVSILPGSVKSNVLHDFTVSFQQNAFLVSLKAQKQLPATVCVYTPAGKKMFQRQINANEKSVKIDCSGLARGMYYVSVHYAAGQKRVRKAFVR
ncbi:MAG: glycosyl hydrolase family 8 [Chitinispirillaceae bacterium]